MAPTFQGMGKIARLNRDIVVTEKVDGSNAAIGISPEGDFWCQSRTRIITPDADNFGFAKWAYGNVDSLVRDLGYGLHFGEWWGLGIQRGYGLDHKRFSLFNTSRWQGADFTTPNLHIVPVLYTGPWIMPEGMWTFSPYAPKEFLEDLRVSGSAAVEGYDRPEGIVVYHTAGNVLFKTTLEKDEKGKGQ